MSSVQLGAEFQGASGVPALQHGVSVCLPLCRTAWPHHPTGSPWQLCAGAVWGSMRAVVQRCAPSTAPDTTRPPSHSTYFLPFISYSSSSRCTLAHLLALFPHFGKFPLLVLPQAATFILVHSNSKQFIPSPRTSPCTWWRQRKKQSVVISVLL